MAWVCCRCGYRVNGGVTQEFVAEHECDPRSVDRHREITARILGELDWPAPPWADVRDPL